MDDDENNTINYSTVKIYDMQDIHDLMSQIVQDYDAIGNTLHTFLTLHNSCLFVAKTDQFVRPNNYESTIFGLDLVNVGLLFVCHDMLVFLQYNSCSPKYHMYENIGNVVFNNNKIVITENDMKYVYTIKDNLNILSTLSKMLELRGSVVKIQNEFFRPKTLKIVLLVTGMREIVEPFVCLALGLLDRGYDVKIVTHEHFRDIVTKFDIEFSPLTCDPVVGTTTNFSALIPHIDSLLEEAWSGCQDANILVSTHMSLAGSHIAEKMQIPFYTVSDVCGIDITMDNSLYTNTVNIINTVASFVNNQSDWLTVRKKINKWRINTLNLHKKGILKVPQSFTTLYNYSTEMYSKKCFDNEYETGYWKSNIDYDFIPSQHLCNFIKKTNIVLINFGSIDLSNNFYQQIVNICMDLELSVVINSKTNIRINTNENVLIADSISLDYILPYTKFMVGSGSMYIITTCMYHKKPILTIPFDNVFWSNRVVELNIGLTIPVLEMTYENIYEAFRSLLKYSEYTANAEALGNKLLENGLYSGIYNAINIIEKNMTTSFVAPSFQNDNDAVECSNETCRVKFGYFGRRHHCRNCGMCFCDSCSSKRIEIPKYRYTKPVRVCSGCYEKITEHNH